MQSLAILPVLAWYLTYYYTKDLVLSTAVILGGTILTTAIEWLITKKISKMQIFLIAAILIFGIPTVIFDDPNIIKWKVTVVNFIFAAVIFIFQYIVRINPFALFFAKELPLPPKGYHDLGRYLMFYFIFAGLLNIVVAFYLPSLFNISEERAEAIWVDYKTFYNAILNTIYIFACLIIIFKRYPEALKKFSENTKNMNKK